MFDRLFQFIRDGVKTAILGGIQDARDELTAKVEAGQPLTIETTTDTNKPKAKRKTSTR